MSGSTIMTWLRTDGLDALEAIAGNVLLYVAFRLWLAYG